MWSLVSQSFFFSWVCTHAIVYKYACYRDRESNKLVFSHAVRGKCLKTGLMLRIVNFISILFILLGLKLFCLKPNEHHLKILCKYLLAEGFSILVRRNQMLFMRMGGLCHSYYFASLRSKHFRRPFHMLKAFFKHAEKPMETLPMQAITLQLDGVLL